MAKKRQASVVRDGGKTVGEYVQERVEQSQYLDHHIATTTKDIVLDYQQDYITNLEETVYHAIHPSKCKLTLLPEPPATHENCLTEPPKEGDFYVVSLLMYDPKLSYVVRNKFFSTRACPSPTYDQSVYKFNKESSELEYLWTVPDEYTVKMWVDDKSAMEMENMPLLDMILKFRSGDLLELSNKMNGVDCGKQLLQ